MEELFTSTVSADADTSTVSVTPPTFSAKSTLDGLAHADGDPFAPLGQEARQFDLDRIRARRHADEPELALGVGHGRLRAHRPDQLDGDAGEHAALLVDDLALHGAGLRLGGPVPARHEHAREDDREQIAMRVSCSSSSYFFAGE